MRRQRFGRLQDQLDSQGVDGLVLLGSSSVAYATGVNTPAHDGDHAALFRPVAVVWRATRRLTSTPCTSTVRLLSCPTDHLHGPLFPDLDDGIDQFAERAWPIILPRGRASASTTRPMRCCVACGGSTGSTPSAVVGAAKITKTPDEVACIRSAQRINELAMVDALAILRPGVRQIDLSAVFLRRIFELGASANGIDPIWQVMAPSRSSARGLCTAISPTRRSPPTGSCARATSSGSTPASPSRVMHPTTAGRGSRASTLSRMCGSKSSSGAGEPWSTRHWTFSSQEFRRWISCRAAIDSQRRRPPLDRTLLPGARRRHRKRRNAVDRNGSRRELRRTTHHGAGNGDRLRTGHLGRGRGWIPIGRHCGRYRYGWVKLSGSTYEPYGLSA